MKPTDGSEMMSKNGENDTPRWAITHGRQERHRSGDLHATFQPHRYSAINAVIWNHGTPSVIPTFRGTAWNTPTAINADNVVVGFANAGAAAGGEFDPRAFIWSHGEGTKRLAMIAGFTTSQASGVDKFRHAAGQSCAADGTCVATLWMPGNKVYDLNALAGSGTLYLYSANDIDDFGRITGQAFDAVSGTYVAYKATPILR